MSISSANSGKKTRFPVRDGALNLAMAVSVSLCINILTAMEWKLNGALGLHLAAFMASLYAGLLVLLYMDVRDESIQAMNQRCAEEEQKNIQAGLDRAEILKKKADITH